MQRRFPFFGGLAPFLDDPKWIVLVDDWNAILDPKTDRVRRGDRGSRWHESSLIDVMARHDLGQQVSSRSNREEDVDVSR